MNLLKSIQTFTSLKGVDGEFELERKQSTFSRGENKSTNLGFEIQTLKEKTPRSKSKDISIQVSRGRREFLKRNFIEIQQYRASPQPPINVFYNTVIASPQGSQVQLH